MNESLKSNNLLLLSLTQAEVSCVCKDVTLLLKDQGSRGRSWLNQAGSLEPAVRIGASLTKYRGKLTFIFCPHETRPGAA